MEHLQPREGKDGTEQIPLEPQKEHSLVTSGVFTLVSLPPEFCPALNHRIFGKLPLCSQVKPCMNVAEAGKPSMISTATKIAGASVFLLHKNYI